MHNLIGEEIIKKFNYDGYQNKLSFKTYSNINNILFKAVEPEVISFDNYIKLLKQGFKIQKNKIYKEKCLKKKPKWIKYFFF